MNNMLNNILRIFTSKKLAVILLILITVSYVMGMLVPQEHLLGKQQFDKWKELNPTWAPIATGLGLTHFFNTWWFLALVGLLLVNTMACTIKQAPRVIKRMRHKGSVSVEPSQWQQTIALNISNDNLRTVQRVLRKKGYNTTAVEDGVYAAKYRWAEVGSLLFHFSLLLIISGAIVSGLWKTSGLVKITEGQIFKGNEQEYLVFQKGYFANTPKDPFLIGVDEVVVKPDPKYDREEYSSQVVVLDAEGRVQEKQEVKVNKNLILRGYTLYMDEYGYSPALIISKDNQELFAAYTALNRDNESMYGEIKIGPEEWDTRIEYMPLSPEAPENKELEVPVNSTLKVSIKDKGKELFNGKVLYGLVTEKSGIRVEYTDLRKYARYIVVKDPGADVVFGGGVLALAGLILLFLTVPKEILVAKGKEGELLLYGRTSRYKSHFEQDFKYLVEQINRETGDLIGGDRNDS